ncbi:DUF456 domain-containing protein [Halobacterium rubrum]|uniref:DUF456 domain-containing protein n=1 Tax=Halobacterium TaxID=2239 RepID=UPI001F36F934|nr:MULTISPECIES: DUF456 domain-containing protein [Halobacterium]MDH5019881.1 DUF456 domain-containing protein [Halobacterium rubrum]
MEPFVAAALVLLAVGVAGSVLPLLPSGLLSLAGLLLYWTQTGRPGPILLVALAGLAVLATLVDWLAGVVGARASGVDTRTSILAGAVGFGAMLVTGPVGLLLGVAGVVFAVEFRENENVAESARRAGYATVGVLGSAAMQVVLTVVVLAAVLWLQFL